MILQYIRQELVLACRRYENTKDVHITTFKLLTYKIERQNLWSIKRDIQKLYNFCLLFHSQGDKGTPMEVREDDSDLNEQNIPINIGETHAIPVSYYALKLFRIFSNNPARKFIPSSAVGEKRSVFRSRQYCLHFSKCPSYCFLVFVLHAASKGLCFGTVP